jgi:tetratricopeptide (TPR) repeat protein
MEIPKISRIFLATNYLLLLFSASFAFAQEVGSGARAGSTTGNLAEMEKRQRAALAARPESPEMHGELGLILLRQGKWEESVEELGIAANKLPNSRTFNMSLAKALLGWGHDGVAVEFLNAVRGKFSQFPEFHYYLGLAHFRMNRRKEALPEFEEALRLEPRLDQAKFGIAVCRAADGDIEGAIKLSRELVKERPANAHYWISLARLLDKMGGQANQLAALRAGRKALALKPSDPTIELNIAIILTRLKRFAEARPLLEHVVKLEPRNLPANVTLASTYSRLGLAALARKQREIVVQLEDTSKKQHPEVMPLDVPPPQ